MGKAMADRQDISARLMPEKNDHPIEGGTEDVAVQTEHLINARIYGRDASRSFSKVNPMVGTVALEASTVCVWTEGYAASMMELPELSCRIVGGCSLGVSLPSAFPLCRTVTMLLSSFKTLNDRGIVLHDDLMECNWWSVMCRNIFSLLSMSCVVRSDSCRMDA